MIWLQCITTGLVWCILPGKLSCCVSIARSLHTLGETWWHALQAVLESGSGRDINRHKYTMEDADEALKQPVVQALLDLCKFRNTHQAFLGDVSLLPCC